MCGRRQVHADRNAQEHVQCSAKRTDSSSAVAARLHCHRRRRRRPFFMAIGFRKPHMPWRFPAPFLQQYPEPSEVAIAAHPTMDASVPSIAHHSPDLARPARRRGGDPVHPHVRRPVRCSPASMSNPHHCVFRSFSAPTAQLADRAQR